MSEPRTDPIARLGALLKKCGASVTFDPERDTTKPCYFCDAPAAPVHDLRVIGRYISGNAIERPVCKVCNGKLENPRLATVAQVVLNHIRDAYSVLKNKSAVAKAIGIDRRTLYRRLEKGGS